MDTVLRCNVIKRDWYDGIDKYYWQHGRRPDYAAINKKTYDALIVYMYKHHTTWNCILNRTMNNVSTPDGRRICVSVDIMFEGVQIFINDELEDEVVRFW